MWHEQFRLNYNRSGQANSTIKGVYYKDPAVEKRITACLDYESKPERDRKKKNTSSLQRWQSMFVLSPESRMDTPKVLVRNYRSMDAFVVVLLRDMENNREMERGRSRTNRRVVM